MTKDLTINLSASEVDLILKALSSAKLDLQADINLFTDLEALGVPGDTRFDCLMEEMASINNLISKIYKSEVSK